MRKRYTSEEKKAILKEAENHFVVDVIQKYGIARPTFYLWKKKNENGEL